MTRTKLRVCMHNNAIDACLKEANQAIERIDRLVEAKQLSPFAGGLTQGYIVVLKSRMEGLKK